MRKLTEKQEKFAQAVGIEGVSQSEAYRRVYNAEKMDEKTLWNRAHELARHGGVAARVAELKAQRVNAVVDNTAFDVKKLLETYLAISFVDPNELIQMRVGACRHCWGEGGGYHWKEREYVEALAAWERKPDGPMPDIGGGFGYRHTAAPNPECHESEGEGIPRTRIMDTTQLSPGAKLLYQGVQQTRDGVKILFANKDKALEQIGRILGAYDDRLRVDLQAKTAQLQITTTDPKEAADAYLKMVSG